MSEHLTTVSSSKDCDTVHTAIGKTEQGVQNQNSKQLEELKEGHPTS